MTQAQLLTDVGQWLLNLTFAVSVLFPVLASLFWPWWDSWWGVNIITLEACIAATLLPSVLYADFGVDNYVLRWVQVTSLGLVAAVIVWRGVLIWRTQRRGG
jgi:hypothetical protein